MYDTSKGIHTYMQKASISLSSDDKLAKAISSHYGF